MEIAVPAFPMPDYDQQALDAQYTNTGTPEAEGDLAALRAHSAEARARLPFETFAYGDGPLETFDLVRARDAHPAPALMFVHGGQWQFNTTAETSFLAAAAHARGMAYVGIDYPKVPMVRLADQAAAIARAWGVIAAGATEMALDSRRLVLVGHSSGAHLAALALVAHLAETPVPPACAVLYSGMYDLEPVRRSSRNGALGLGEAEAREASPAARIGARVPPVLTVAGTAESAEFQRQARLFDAAIGGAPHRLTLLAGQRHFTTPLDLFDYNSQSWSFIDTNLAKT